MCSCNKMHMVFLWGTIIDTLVAFGYAIYNIMNIYARAEVDV